MSNNYYNATGVPAQYARGLSSPVRNEYSSVEAGFDKLPNPDVLAGNAQNFYSDTGTVNNVVIASLNSNISAYYDGMELAIRIAYTNTSTMTITPGALAIKPLLRSDGNVMQAGDLTAGTTVLARYSTSEGAFRMQQVLTASASGGLPTTGGTMTGPINEAKGADIASAATINLTGATGNFVHVTGTTTITAITIPSGAERVVTFDGSLTLTHNATTLILPGGANIQTAAGDSMIVRGDGAGNARIVSYSRANGHPNVGSMVLIASMNVVSAAAVDFLTTFNSSYDNYCIFIEGIKPSTTDALKMRFANAGVVDTGSNYQYGTASGPLTNNATSIPLDANTLAAGIGLSGKIFITNVNSASSAKIADLYTVYQYDATPLYGGLFTALCYLNSSAISGFRLFWNGGNNFAAQGKIYVYGIQNS